VTTATATRGKSARSRVADYSSWEEALNQEPVLRALEGARQLWRGTKNRADADFYKALHEARLRLGDKLIRSFLIGRFEMSDGEVDKALLAAELWKRVPDEQLWEAAGRNGVAMIAAIADKGHRRRVLATVKDRANKNADHQVSGKYIRATMERLGAATTEVAHPTASRGPQTKTGTVVTFNQLLRAAREFSAFLVRDPSAAGCFSAEVLDTLKKLPPLAS
jgi:hypothetical protein